MSLKTSTDNLSKKTNTGSLNDGPGLPYPVQYRGGRPRSSPRIAIVGVFSAVAVLALLVSAGMIFFAAPQEATEFSQPRLKISLNPTVSTATPVATPLPPLPGNRAAGQLAFLEPTTTPTSVPGGQALILRPAQGDLGYVVTDSRSVTATDAAEKYFGDSYLYAGILNGQVFHAAFQFDLSEIPRGSKIYGASLRLTGLRAVQFDEGRRGEWRLQLLGSEIDSYWRTASNEQIQNVTTWDTFKPPLTQEQLGVGRLNHFEFSPEQIALLERRLVESTDQTESKVSFRVDGPTEGSNNLFAWDSGYGTASQGSGPLLFLNLGPSPEKTPPPYYVMVTSTPTPENVMTAAAISAQITAEATRFGTATPPPPNWVTPIVVTSTPTAANQATAQALSALATAIALTTGEPPSNQVTATATPTYVIITSTPYPENMMTAAAIGPQVSEAIPLPDNWVTPFVVTSTPPPANNATAEFRRADILAFGTPTPLPGNVQTATPTPITIAAQPLAAPTATATPSPTPQPVPSALLGKIIFLSDREGATEEERLRADKRGGPPKVDPQPYVFDPTTRQLERLTDFWPYDVAAARETWSADKNYETYTQPLLWTNINGKPTEVLAIHYYDHIYKVEVQVTRFGAGIAWDPVWSPVRHQIAFMSNVSGDDEIWVINHDGSNPLQLTSSNEAYNAREIGKDTFIPEVNGHPSWSPDGSSLVFWSNRSGQRQIWIMNTDGSDQRLLMESNPYNDWNPIWIKFLEPAPPPGREPSWQFTKPPDQQR